MAGVSSGARKVALYASQLNDAMVLENDVVFGSVNANRRHYDAALEALQHADRGWLERLISQRVALHDYRAAFVRERDDVKVVLAMQT